MPKNFFRTAAYYDNAKLLQKDKGENIWINMKINSILHF